MGPSPLRRKQLLSPPKTQTKWNFPGAEEPKARGLARFLPEVRSEAAKERKKRDKGKIRLGFALKEGKQGGGSGGINPPRREGQGGARAPLANKTA